VGRFLTRDTDGHLACQAAAWAAGTACALALAVASLAAYGLLR
jgi:hypothetical protein